VKVKSSGKLGFRIKKEGILFCLKRQKQKAKAVLNILIHQGRAFAGSKRRKYLLSSLMIFKGINFPLSFPAESNPHLQVLTGHDENFIGN
jgi:hypothetical protein